MKFYCAGKLLDRIETQEYDLIMGVTIRTPKRGYIRKDTWGSGWLFEADESFKTWCPIAYGFDLAPILDSEFYLLNMDSVAYLNEERTLELRKYVISQLSLIAINS